MKTRHGASADCPCVEQGHLHKDAQVDGDCRQQDGACRIPPKLVEVYSAILSSLQSRMLVPLSMGRRQTVLFWVTTKAAPRQLSYASVPTAFGLEVCHFPANRLRRARPWQLANRVRPG